MFDTMEIAKRIKAAHIAKNMTQMQLADIMGVSYQAVSNWERGNSMPDISKLADLCNALDLTVNELLGMEEKTAAAVTKAMEKEELTVEELQEVAPMLPPEQLREQLEGSFQTKDEAPEQKRGFLYRRFGGRQEKDTPQKGKFSLSAIAGLAPFLDEEYLSKLATQAEAEDLSEITAIAPFLSEEALDELVGRCQACGDFGTIMGLAPFLSKATLNSLVEAVEVDDITQVISLAPFLNEDTLDKLVERCDVQADISLLCGLAPFLSEEALGKLVDRALEQDDVADMDCIGGLAPFLSKETLRKVADKLM